MNIGEKKLAILFNIFESPKKLEGEKGRGGEGEKEFL
jgi:hypothetical protein